VVGRNGSGKSTLLGVLTGRRTPTPGGSPSAATSPSASLDQSGTLPPGRPCATVVLPESLFAAEHEWAADDPASAAC
jgi:ATP-binding cassette subfamily F protein uup